MDVKPKWIPDDLLGSPLFEPLHPVIARMDAEQFPTLDDLNALLARQCPEIRVARGLPVHFVPQAHGRLAFEAQYEPRCFLTGAVQTRADNWHDLYNALVWLTFPRAKAAVNLRHFQALTDGAAAVGRRGAVRDTTTLLDESGVVVAYADDELAGLLRGFQWKTLFWDQRERLEQGMDFVLFGHGLYEKAMQPYIGMTGQGLLLRVTPEYFTWPLSQRLAHLDEALASYLADPGHCRDTAELSPVPLLGIPGWSSDSARQDFYDDVAYFRPGRGTHKK
jgi:hypothetical protein